MGPVDEGHFAYIIFFWLGAGFLFPWNAFITAVDYFAFLYPEAHVDFAFGVAYMLPNLIVLVLLIAFGRHYTSKFRISLGFGLFFCLIILIPILDLITIKGGKGTQLSLVLTIGAVVASGAIDAVVQGSLFGYAAELPERYTQALVGGTSASGVIISCARIITKASLPNTNYGLRLSANIYFTVSAVFVGICIIGFQTLNTLPIIMYYKQPKCLDTLEAGSEAEGVSNVESPLVLSQNRDSLEGNGKDLNLLEKFFQSDVLTTEGRAMALHTDSQINYFAVLKKLSSHAFTLTFVYLVTLSIFPGFISEGVHSEYLADWYPVILMALFNVGDFVGKMTPVYWMINEVKYLVAGSLLRILFFPLYGLCIYGPSILRTEVPIILLTISLGYTNGLYTSWLMMTGPSRVSQAESEAAGVIMVLFLVLGLTLGSIAGWLWLLVL